MGVESQCTCNLYLFAANLSFQIGQVWQTLEKVLMSSRTWLRERPCWSNAGAVLKL